ncbi:MAG: HAMP domain-containing sensor histidine kinase [Candidatus Nealsonbacteria bacterium]|nr:HAMP domain-containing sensor histidine kinase [Candidatus Nealsonbacteria bacterium]
MRKKEFSKKQKTEEMVSIIAHQLKSPVAAIKGYLEALISGDCGQINNFQKEYLSDALENLIKMSGFIDNLLDVSRIEEEHFEVKLKPTSLENVAEKVISDLSVWTEASNCKVLFEKPESSLPKVLTDPDKIEKVIQNLVTNAVKYKKIGPGNIEIKIEKEGQKILFSCKDNGIGIPQEDLKKVFTKFYRSKKAMTIDIFASGIGLYINKATIELSGGKIWFVRNKKGGTTFYFTLPIVKN